MTIKQQGGIFGRNPEYNELDTKGDTNLGDGAVFVDSTNKRLGIDKTNPAYPLDFDIDASGQLARFGDANAATYVSFAQPRAYVGYMGGGAALMGGTNKDVIIYAGASNVDDADARVAVFEHTTGNLNLNIGAGRGNLILGSGQGIDFSATSGTGTSELFDDYEEGTWTPTDNSGGGLSLTVTAAAYTKIGRSVFASFNITYPSTSDTNYAILGGLPFVSKNNGSVSIGYTNESTLARGATGSADDTTFALYDTSGNLIQNSALSGNIIRATVIYYSA